MSTILNLHHFYLLSNIIFFAAFSLFRFHFKLIIISGQRFYFRISPMSKTPLMIRKNRRRRRRSHRKLWWRPLSLIHAKIWTKFLGWSFRFTTTMDEKPFNQWKQCAMIENVIIINSNHFQKENKKKSHSIHFERWLIAAFIASLPFSHSFFFVFCSFYSPSKHIRTYERQMIGAKKKKWKKMKHLRTPFTINNCIMSITSAWDNRKWNFIRNFFFFQIDCHISSYLLFFHLFMIFFSQWFLERLTTYLESYSDDSTVFSWLNFESISIAWTIRVFYV